MRDGLISMPISRRCRCSIAVRPDHPRIFFTHETIAETRANIAANGDLAAVYQKLKSRAMWDNVGGVSWNVQDHASMIALPYLLRQYVRHNFRNSPCFWVHFDSDFSE